MSDRLFRERAVERHLRPERPGRLSVVRPPRRAVVLLVLASMALALGALAALDHRMREEASAPRVPLGSE